MKNKPYSNQSPKEGWSWETPPDKIPEEQVKETLTSDVVVIGAGISGLAASTRLAQRVLRSSPWTNVTRPAVMAGRLPCWILPL